MEQQNTIDIETLIQDQHNFNRGTEEGGRLMEKSLKELGAGRSILIDKDGNIIAGNKTQLAAIKAGIKKVRVIESDGTELIAVKRTDVEIDSKQGRELALADNLTTQINLSWDNAELESVAVEKGIDLGDWGMEMPQTETIEELDAQEDDFDEEKDKVETVCQEGDLWQLGEHRLLCGDSTKTEDVQRLMQGEQAHLWLTDPPYNTDIVGGSHAISAEERKKLGKLTIQNDKMDSDKFFSFLQDAFAAAYDVMSPGASFYLWLTSREYVNFELALNSVGLQVRQQLIWNKNSLVMGRQDYQQKHEPCLYGWKEGAAHYFVNLRNEVTVIPDAEEIDIDKMKKEEMRQLLHQIYESKVPTTVLDEARPPRSEDHPTMKPVRLFARLVRNSSRKGEIVLDTFGGSGTTIVACEQLNRKARLMELDPHYCDVIIARWEKLTGQKATRL